MSAYHTSDTNQSAQSPIVAKADKRSRWICDQCKRQFCGVKSCPFCYRTITAEETTKLKSL